MSEPHSTLVSLVPMVPSYWTGGVAQVVKHLSSKCKALSSNPSTVKKKKKKVT
jgi:hypothetical protein